MIEIKNNRLKHVKKGKKKVISSLCVQSGNSIKIVFETEDSIQNYFWASKDNQNLIIGKTTNSKNLSLLDKVIFEIQNYQNQNNIFVKILYVLGSLKNDEEIFDSILIEENFIDCNNLVPLLNNANNISELVNKKGINFYDKLINKSNDVFFNMFLISYVHSHSVIMAVCLKTCKIKIKLMFIFYLSFFSKQL